MMKRLLIQLLLTSILLAGCKQEDSRLSLIPERLPDLITESGIFVYIETITPRSHAGVFYASDENTEEEWMKESIENQWIKIQSCLDMTSTEAPAMIIVEDLKSWLNEKGYYPKSDTGYALLSQNVIVVKDDIALPFRTWRHEMIHIVLHQNGVPNSVNSEHKPEYLWRCEHAFAYDNDS